MLLDLYQDHCINIIIVYDKANYPFCTMEKLILQCIKIVVCGPAQGSRSAIQISCPYVWLYINRNLARKQKRLSVSPNPRPIGYRSLVERLQEAEAGMALSVFGSSLLKGTYTFKTS